eukprot:7385898-Prymnesium_polylepis.1
MQAELLAEGNDRRASPTRRSSTCPALQPLTQTSDTSAASQSGELNASALLEMLEKMLMGGRGAPIRSGMQRLAAELSPALVYYISEASDALFNKHGLAAVQESAGQVDREESRAYLALEALGEPLLPADEISSTGRPLGRQFGESLRVAAVRLDKKVKAAIKKASRVKGGPGKEAVTLKTLLEQPTVEIE